MGRQSLTKTETGTAVTVPVGIKCAKSDGLCAWERCGCRRRCLGKRKHVAQAYRQLPPGQLKVVWIEFAMPWGGYCWCLEDGSEENPFFVLTLIEPDIS
jgi:hypothetical protein